MRDKIFQKSLSSPVFKTTRKTPPPNISQHIEFFDLNFQKTDCESKTSSYPSSIKSHNSFSTESSDSDNSEISLNLFETIVGFISDLIDIISFVCNKTKSNKKQEDKKRDIIEFKQLDKELKAIKTEIRNIKSNQNSLSRNCHFR